MAKKSKERLDTSGGDSLGQNPFAALSDSGLPEGPASPTPPAPTAPAPAKKKPGMRLDVRREKSGRGGKTVTVIDGVAPLGETKAKALLKELQNHCGTGGAYKRTSLELQGDKVAVLVEELGKRGFRAVKSGG